MRRSEAIWACALVVLVIVLALAGCSAIPGNGPLAGQAAAQGQSNGRVLFDVVPVDEHVVATLLAQPSPDFATRFKTDGKPPDLKIAVGDTLQVLLWQSGEGGLLAPAAAPPVSAPLGPALPVPRLVPRLRPHLHSSEPAPGIVPVAAMASGAAAIPDQPVEPDGTITIPYAGRIVAAGHTAEEVQREIEQRLAGKTLEPQALVIDEKSPGNSVSTSGEILKGGRVPLSPAGDRLLQIIAAAGGAHAPVRDVFVRLSRGGTTATIALRTLVSDPAENIYAQPGDVLTLIRVPQTFAVFGAAKRNAAVPFGADRLSLAEALAKSRGLNDNLANPSGVFLFRWEPDSIVRSLGEPIAPGGPNGLSPIAYRFDLDDAKSYLLAREFPVHDKDVIFVADADIVPLRKVFEVVGSVVGPFTTGLLICRRTKC